MKVKRLTPGDVELVRHIDRSEHVDVQYAVVDGELVERPVVMAEVPSWFTEGDGDFTVAHHVAHVRDDLDRGGTLLGAFVDDDVAGLATIVPTLDGDRDLAQLAWLHVSRPYRRHGAASALWAVAADIARAAGATAMYVSATSTGSAVGFYLSRGCRLADPVHPRLYELEPDDIHLVCSL